MRPVRALYAIVLSIALVLSAACGAGADKSTTPRDGAVVVQAANGAVTIPSRPERIVSLAPTHTETLFAIGAGDQVVAVDDYSTFPAEAPRTKLSGFKPNAEAIIGYKPDLVILSNDTDGIVKALEKVKIPVLLQPAANTFEEVYDEIIDLGIATGREKPARELADGMRKRIAQAVDGTPKKNLTYFHELDSELSTVTSTTFIGRVYGLFGLRNIADPADKTKSGYPKLSREALLSEDPDLIFLADTRCCGQTAKTVAERPGWKDLKAVRNGGVVELDDDIVSRWGPRLPDFVQAIADAVEKASAGR